MRGLLFSLLALIATVSAAKGGAREIRSKDEYDRIIAHHKLTGMPVVVDYYSDSCGPCRQIAPRYAAMAKEFKDRVVFLKVNVQTRPDVATNIRSMPTFRFFVNGKQKHQFSGADENQIRQYATKFSKAWAKSPKAVTAVKTKKELKKILADAATMPVVVAFVSKDNDDCKLIYPVIKELNKQNQGKAFFVKIYPAESEELADFGRVTDGDTPITQIYVSRKKVDEVVGPNEAQLREKVAAAIAKRAEKGGKGDKGDKGGDKKKETNCPEPKTPLRPQTRTPLRMAIAESRAEKIVIVGAGPAGLSTAIYAARAGLQPVLIAPDMGGQLMFTKEVENYPALVDGTGPALIDLMRVQAEQFETQFESTVVTNIDFSARPFTLTTNQTKNNVIKAHTLVIATGADARWLEVPGEEAYRAKGISSCATCDGFLFKDKPVVVIGGGDTAMEEALFLARVCSEVTIIHRRDMFRASFILQKRVLAHKKIKVIWNHQVSEFKGKGEGLDAHVTHAVIEDVNTKETVELEAQGVFVAIGHIPNTDLFKGVLDMDAHGYLTVKERSTATSLDGVFAAGDVADSVYRQAVTSAGSGAMAALDAERYLNENEVEEEGDVISLLAQVDLSTWSVKMLKALMKDQGISMKGCLEKKDFIERLRESTAAASASS